MVVSGQLITASVSSRVIPPSVLYKKEFLRKYVAIKDYFITGRANVIFCAVGLR